MAKVEYANKAKEPKEAPAVQTQPPQQKQMKREVCLLCKGTDVIVKEFDSKGKSGPIHVKQVHCQRSACKYVATYINGRIV